MRGNYIRPSSLKRRMFTLAAAALGLGTGLLVTALSSPMYYSDTKILVPRPPLAKQDVLDPSTPVLKWADRHVRGGRPLALSELRSRITVIQLGRDSYLIRARGPTPTQAERTANAVAEGYRRQYSAVHAVVLDRARAGTRTKALSSALYSNGALGLFIGLLIGQLWPPRLRLLWGQLKTGIATWPASPQRRSP